MPQVKRKASPSGSSIIHGLLVQQEIGWEFTAQQLEEYVRGFDENFSNGCFTGFIARATKKGMLVVVGKHANHTVWRLASKEDWRFAGKGHGSYPGREIRRGSASEKIVVVDSLTALSEQVFQRHAHGAPNDGKIEPSLNAAEWQGGGKVTLIEPRDPTPKAVWPMFHQLTELAHSVLRMEQQVKSLADFTTDELLAEIKQRTAR